MPSHRSSRARLGVGALSLTALALLSACFWYSQERTVEVAAPPAVVERSEQEVAVTGPEAVPAAATTDGELGIEEARSTAGVQDAAAGRPTPPRVAAAGRPARTTAPPPRPAVRPPLEPQPAPAVTGFDAAKTPEPPEEEDEKAKENYPPYLQPCIDRFVELRNGGYAPRSLIATLPDPLDSPFARGFDVYFLAIQQAMADEHFLQDRVCLAWGAKAEADRDGRSGDGCGCCCPTAKRERADDRPLHHTWPSVVLFRREGTATGGTRGTDPAADGGSAASGQIYAVLVVGEMLHTGVRADAMAQALELVVPTGKFAAAPAPVEQTADPTAVKTATPVEILGPAFSGSADSLIVALETWDEDLRSAASAGQAGDGGGAAAEPERAGSAAEPPAETPPQPAPAIALRIRSGSATNTGLAKRFETGLAGLSDRFVVNTFIPPGATNDDLQACAWNRLVPERLGLRTRWEGQLEPGHPCPSASAPGGEDNPRVALLVESSPYGRQFKDSEFRVVPFPTHIAALRSAYQELGKGDRDRDEEDGTLPRLPFELRAPELRGLPAYGELGTLTSQDLLLNNALRRLARDRVLLVGIIATSTEDKLFLAEKVRSFAPDVRILTFEGDVLLTHPDYYRWTAGTLVLSSHPMAEPSPLEQRREGRGEVSLLFDFDTAHGLYRAVHAMIRGEHEAPSLEMWASVVGKHRLVPVERFSTPSASAPAAASRAASAGRDATESDRMLAGLTPGRLAIAPGELPTLWSLLLFIVSVLLVAIALRGNRDLRAGGKALLGVVPVDLVRPSRWQRPRRGDRVLHALVALLPIGVGVLYFVVAVPALSPDPAEASMRFAGLPDSVLGWFVSVCLSLLTAASCFLLIGLYQRTYRDLVDLPGSGRPLPQWWRLRVLAPLAVATLLTLALCTLAFRAIAYVWFDGGAGSSLLVRRALALSGGASPLLPALLMAGVVMAWVLLALRRRELLGRVAPHPDDPAPGAACTEGVGESCWAIWRAVDPLADGRVVLYCWIALVTVPMLYLSSLHGHGRLAPVLRSFEGPVFDFSLTALLVAAVMTSVAAGVSLVRGWLALREFARSIAGRIELSPRHGRNGLPKAKRLRRELEGLDDAASGELMACLDDDEVGLAGRWLGADRWLREHPDAAGGVRRDAEPAAGDEGPAADGWTYSAGDAPAEEPPSAPREEARTAVHAAATDFRAEAAAYLLRLAVEQLRWLMVFLTVSLLVLFLAVGVYPFEPRRMLLAYLGFLIVLAAGVCIGVILQIDKEKALVGLDGVESGARGWHQNLPRLAFYAGLPAVSLLAGRFPELRHLVGTWLGPLIEAVK